MSQLPSRSRHDAHYPDTNYPRVKMHKRGGRKTLLAKVWPTAQSQSPPPVGPRTA